MREGRHPAESDLASEGDLNTTAARMRWRAAQASLAASDIVERDADVFLHQSLSTPCLDEVVGAQGAWLTMASGRRLLDCHGNSAHQVGYGHPRVLEAIRNGLETLPFAPRRFTNRPAVELAEALAARAPGDLGKILFAPSGAAAVSMALKLARVATGRHKTISMWDSFHGANLDTISVGGEAVFRRDAGPLLPGTEHVPPPGLAGRFFGDDGRGPERLADYIDYVLEVQGDVAAVLAEPVRWTTIEPPPPDFWPRVRAACDRHGALLIFDEIPSCLGRAGAWFCCENVGAVPDILVIGKGLGGAVMPLAAMIARCDLDIAGDRALGHYTHEKSPVASAAGLATLQVIEEEDLCNRSVRLGAMARDHLSADLAGLETVRAIRGLGLSLAIELDTPDRAETVLYACLDRGVSFKIGAGRVISLCPPLTVAEDDLEGGLETVASAIRAAS